MNSIIIITGYIDGEELSKLWNYTDERKDLITEITDLLDEHYLSSDMNSSLESLIDDDILAEERVDEFKKLLPKCDDLYPEELSEIKIVEYKVIEGFNLPA